MNLSPLCDCPCFPSCTFSTWQNSQLYLVPSKPGPSHRDDLSDPGSHTGAASCSEPDILEPVSHDGAASCSEPDILEHEVKRTLGSARANTASEGDGIPAKLFKILKDDAIKTLHSTRQQIWKTQQWPPDWKIQSASQFPGGAVRKNVQTTRPLHSPPTLVRLCLKSSKLGFSIT